MKSVKNSLVILSVFAVSSLFLSPAFAQIDPTGEGESSASSAAATTSTVSNPNEGQPGSLPNQEFITGIGVGAAVGVVLGGVLGWVLKRDPR